ncbi:hypothetical protein [Leptolyngbya sp. PCC 6406]|uniref:hypothetical protein n=1 Tax=Leptolyngbya sp. PCC 6406 TaxID=1173264 RepID=UPI0012DEE5DB|nr:hypothetical protein [Leptolyngbya sp. PCC 6406]
MWLPLWRVTRVGVYSLTAFKKGVGEATPRELACPEGFAVGAGFPRPMQNIAVGSGLARIWRVI